MSYHVDFWVATAAATPVLLLATYVPYLDFALTKLSKYTVPLSNMPKQIKSYAFGLGYVCVLLNEAVFVASLYSLSELGDAVAPLVIVVIMAFVMLGLVTLIGIRTLAPALSDEYPE